MTYRPPHGMSPLALRSLPAASVTQTVMMFNLALRTLTVTLALTLTLTFPMGSPAEPRTSRVESLGYDR